MRAFSQVLLIALVIIIGPAPASADAEVASTWLLDFEDAPGFEAQNRAEAARNVATAGQQGSNLCSTFWLSPEENARLAAEDAALKAAAAAAPPAEDSLGVDLSVEAILSPEEAALKAALQAGVTLPRDASPLGFDLSVDGTLTPAEEAEKAADAQVPPVPDGQRDHCYTCPTSDFGLTPSQSYQTHATSFAAGGCRLYEIYLYAYTQYRFSFCEGGGSCSADATLRLYNAACASVAYNDDSCGLCSQLDYVPATAGYYYLRVGELGDNASLTYTLAYRSIPPVCLACPNYDYYLGGGGTAYQTHTGQVLVGGCKVYLFSLNRGCRYRFTFCEGGGTADFDTYLTLRDANCTIVASNDDACGVRSEITYLAATSGWYYLEVNSCCTGGSGGNYTLAYCWLHPCDHATPMALATTYSGMLTTVGLWSTYPSCSWTEPGEERVYAFTPALTAKYTFTATQPSGDPDFFLLSDCDPNMVATNLVGGCWGVGSVTVCLSAGDTCYLVVDNYSGANPASYTVRVDPYNPCASFNPMALGTTYSGTLSTCGVWMTYTGCPWAEPGEERVYAFTTAAAGTYTLTATAFSGDPDFYLLTTCDPSGPSALNACWDSGARAVNLAASTTYYLVVDNYDDYTSASYALRVDLPPVAPGAWPVDTLSKGSVLVFPKIESRWTAAGELLQTTIVALNNDFPMDGVQLTLLFYTEYGVFMYADMFLLANQPVWWFTDTGAGSVSLPGWGLPLSIPDPEGTGERVTRGALVVCATDAQGQEIAHNHLYGGAYTVGISAHSSSYYAAWAFRCENGPDDVPYRLVLDGAEYAAPPDALLMDFRAAGGQFDAGAAVPNGVLTLMPMALDFHFGGAIPNTLASLTVFNAAAVVGEGPWRCVDGGWDEARFTHYAASDNYLTRAMLQTDRGLAHIEALPATEAHVCPDAAGLPPLGVAVNWKGQNAAVNVPLVSTGAQAGVIYLPEPERKPSALPASPRPDRHALEPRATLTRTGSLLVFPLVELLWEEPPEVAGPSRLDLAQDTFLELSNDADEPVRVHLALVHGDPALAAAGGERAHPGWRIRHSHFTIQPHQPVSWSAAGGGPDGTAPFTVLDPGSPPGRPVPGAPDGRTLRGLALVWAVDAGDREICWNHLSGHAVLVQHGNDDDWSYAAYSFAALEQGGTVAEGDPTGTPGVLNLDGVEFAYPPQYLLMDFFFGGYTFDHGGWPPMTTSEIRLAAVALPLDLRREGAPTSTNARFFIYDEECTSTYADLCWTGWDWRNLATPGSVFMIDFLGTVRGRAILNAGDSAQCTPVAQDAPLLGVQMHQYPRGAGALPGAGVEASTIQSELDCNDNGVADSFDLGGLFSTSFAAQPVNTPIGTVTYDVPRPPAATGTLTFLINGTPVPPGYVALEVNDVMVGAAAWNGVMECAPQFTVLQVPAEAFNAAVAGGDAALEFINNGAFVCPGATLSATMWYSISASPDANSNGVPDECEAPPPPPPCRGDCNCDGNVGFADIDFFVAGIPSNETAWRAKFPGGTPPAGCTFANCDVDGDGNVGFADIDPFVGKIPSACP